MWADSELKRWLEVVSDILLFDVDMWLMYVLLIISGGEEGFVAEWEGE